MSANPTLQELLEVQKYFGLPSPALVEKDWHVVKALTAVTSIDASPFRIIFSGGTALARAHMLVRRMSEDVDFKIVPADALPLSGSTRHKRLSLLRDRITTALQGAGFSFDPTDERQLRVRNSSRYAVYNLPYEAAAGTHAELRPTIQVELTYTTLSCPAVSMPVASFIAEAFGHPPELPAIDCIGVTETAAEKFVSLTRRTAMEIAGLGPGADPMLVRHIYDLNIIRTTVEPDEVARLARQIAITDAAEYKNQYPAYEADISGETRKALAAITGEPIYRDRYARFVRAMVYGEKPEFDQAMGTIKELAALFCSSEDAP